MLTVASSTLLDWASSQGARVSDSIEISSSAAGRRGLFAVQDIPADTELVTLPSRLQLGVEQLAAGKDTEMQSLARDLLCAPALLEDVEMQSLIRDLPCALALWAEMRRGSASIFDPYLQELPEGFSNAVAPCMGSGAGQEALAVLAPAVAAKVVARRSALEALHESLAPSSLILRDLCWAAAASLSRSLTRDEVRPLTPRQVGRIGEFSAADRNRLLPVIDLANHGGEGANADVRHLPDRGAPDEPPDAYAASLVSRRRIRAGEEVLLS